MAHQASLLLCGLVRAAHLTQSNRFLQPSVHSLPEDALSSSSEESFRANVESLYLMNDQTVGDKAIVSRASSLLTFCNDQRVAL